MCALPPPLPQSKGSDPAVWQWVTKENRDEEFRDTVPLSINKYIDFSSYLVLHIGCNRRMIGTLVGPAKSELRTRIS